MRREGNIRGMVYEATLKDGNRVYRVFRNDKLLAECNAKELRGLPRQFIDKGLGDIANDMIDSLPNFKRCTCIVCGKSFVGASARNYTCSPMCYEERHRARERAAYMKRVGVTSRTMKKETKRDVNEDAVKEAKRLGMSYGKYKAMQYIQSGGARVDVEGIMKSLQSSNER